jgi:hypothetical protein
MASRLDQHKVHHHRHERTRGARRV